jgi:hypothetical protein
MAARQARHGRYQQTSEARQHGGGEAEGEGARPGGVLDLAASAIFGLGRGARRAKRPPVLAPGRGGALPGGQPQRWLIVGLVGHARQDRLGVVAGERVDRQAGGVVVLPGQGEPLPLVVGVGAAGHLGPPSGWC